jgi:Domain of unknown function (DUF4438), N-terminal/Domain of unknown function (DUF4438), C-terminal
LEETRLIKTNKEKLLELNAMGEINHPQLISGRSYVTTWDGHPKLSMGYGGINYTVKIGDSVFGWEESDHAEPGVSVSNKDSASNHALCSYSCIGNEATVLSGDAKGSKGIITGKSGYVMKPDSVLIHFDAQTLEKLAIGDKIQVRTKGLGIKFEGFDQVKMYGLDPALLEKMGITEEERQLNVPVTMAVPPQLMGQGVGERPAEFGYWCIQTTCPESIEDYDLRSLKIGDVVALIDQYCAYGRGYYKGAVTIGVVIHGASDIAGHGPGVNPVITCKTDEISYIVDPRANVARYLGLREDLKW